jgi:pyruvate/2-oxoacid:ferredoxin oxidoreductase beta subunit
MKVNFFIKKAWRDARKMYKNGAPLIDVALQVIKNLESTIRALVNDREALLRENERLSKENQKLKKELKKMKEAERENKTLNLLLKELYKELNKSQAPKIKIIERKVPEIKVIEKIIEKECECSDKSESNELRRALAELIKLKTTKINMRA